jgi:hypothetical protein
LRLAERLGREGGEGGGITEGWLVRRGGGVEAAARLLRMGLRRGEEGGWGCDASRLTGASASKDGAVAIKIYFKPAVGVKPAP